MFLFVIVFVRWMHLRIGLKLVVLLIKEERKERFHMLEHSCWCCVVVFTSYLSLIWFCLCHLSNKKRTNERFQYKKEKGDFMCPKLIVIVFTNVVRGAHTAPWCGWGATNWMRRVSRTSCASQICSYIQNLDMLVAKFRFDHCCRWSDHRRCRRSSLSLLSHKTT